jgi:predicted nuclease of restriction endonuclease-like (RecB) superfamily
MHERELNTESSESGFVCAQGKGDVLNRGSQRDFDEILGIIEKSRESAFRAVNRELISMYWDIGKYISEKVREDGWGKSVVKEFARYVQNVRPELKGFSASNLWRMRQFYETYCKDEKLAPLVREISWTHNLLIMSRSKTENVREFYLQLCAKNKYSKRELKRQMDSMLYERTMISGEKLKQLPLSDDSLSSLSLSALRDSYVLEFLDLPEAHSEKELRKSIVSNMRTFILEFGKDLTFVGENYRLQVGESDFYIDLLFYSRGLSCLFAIELKKGDFQPGHLGQLEFYLEALDRDVRKPGENPSVGLILCTGKNDTVAEYALSRSMSPALIADYQLYLPSKDLLNARLRELHELASADGALEVIEGKAND